MKLLTIVTVCFNSSRTIEKCINSILPQLTDEIEYVIIDGKSTDGTVEILNAYSKSGIKIISEEDKGIYDAMNKGISLANGRWIWFVNSDDIIQDSLLSKIVATLHLHDNYDCVYGDMEYVRIIHGNRYSEIKIAPDDISEIKNDMIVGHPSCLCKVDALKQINGFDTRFAIAADWDLILRMYNNKMRFLHVNQTFSRFFTGGASSKNHSFERHLVRRKNHSYHMIDLYYYRDVLKNIIQDFVKPIRLVLLTRRSNLMK